MTPKSQTLRIPYKWVDGLPIPTDIHIPLATSQTLSPVLIMVHGGAFMLGHASMNNADQIEDCLGRGWIVLAVEHRLCPGVSILEGPMTDVRDALNWVQTNGLTRALEEACVSVRPDTERVMAMGTSSGGHLALSLAFDVPKPPLAILDFYGAKGFADPFWSEPIPSMKDHHQPPPPQEIEDLRNEKHTLTWGVSLEGQSPSASGADSKARQAFALYSIATGKLVGEIWPGTPNDLERIDPMLNVTKAWPPTAFVHGTADIMIPMRFSKELEAQLRAHSIQTEFIEVHDEPHTFAGRMVKGSETWETQRKGFDFLEQVLRSSYNGQGCVQ